MPLDPAQAEAIKQQCIFCQIVSGAVSARRVYEDESFVGVLDINPGNPGHTLLLSKEHYAVLPELPEFETGKLGIAVKNVSQALLRSLKAHGTTIFVANGAAAGQRAPHLIVHVIPRAEGDGLGLTLPQRDYAEGQRFALAKELSKLFGGPAPEEPAEEAAEKSTEEPAAEEKKKSAQQKAEKKPKEERAEVKPQPAKAPAKGGLDEVAEFLLKGGGHG